MRIETIKGWMLVGFGLLIIGMLLYVFEVTEADKLAQFVAVMGLVYFGIGVVLTIMHDQHMIKRTRAGRE
jgi:hypothetical protein